ncbi:MAG: PAS domain S-box protein [Synechococcus sp.]|nr:PAS domain S-box protein [Synechococcus sp.]
MSQTLAHLPALSVARKWATGSAPWQNPALRRTSVGLANKMAHADDHPVSRPRLIQQQDHQRNRQPSDRPEAAGSNPVAVPSIKELQQGDRPFVLADSLGQIVAINSAFEQAYGWRDQQLRGRSLGVILPAAFQMSHQLGFSRFQALEISTILAHPLRLKTVCVDGREVVSEHFIVAEKIEGVWVFGATLTPLQDQTQTDA